MTSPSLGKKADAVTTKTVQPARNQPNTKITDILTLAVRENDIRTEFKKLKGKDRTKTRFHHEGTNWDMDNVTKDMYNEMETVTKRISTYSKCPKEK